MLHPDYMYVARDTQHSNFKMSWQEAHPTGLKWLIPSHVLLIIWIFPQYCKEESYHDSDLHAAVQPNTSRRKGGKKWQACTETYWLIGYPAETPQPQSNTVRPPSNGNAKRHGSVVSAQMITSDSAVTPKHEMSQERSRCISTGPQAISYSLKILNFNVLSWNKYRTNKGAF